ncbi:M28 family peptidase [Candidatus Bathyarchaeota archaeon]|nr:M28 family peptidase [Candidatus Bathyarchaeota archaeon]
MNRVEMETELEDIVRSISFPRYSGTDGWKKAREILLSHFKRLGFNHSEESFTASDFFMRRVNTLPYFITGIYVAILTIVNVFFVIPVASILMGAFLVVIAFTIEKIIQAIKYPVIHSKFGIKHEATNILIENPVRKKTENPRHVLYFIAHTDSKSETPSPHVLFTIIYLSIFFGSIIVGIHSVTRGLVLLLDAGAKETSPFHPHLSYGFVIAFVDALRVITRYGPGKSPGANDDGTGIAILMMLEKEMERQTLALVDFKCVLVGAEELGEVGTHHFILAREEQGVMLNPRRDHFVIIDGIAGNNMYYFTREGWRMRPFSAFLVPLFDNFLQEQDGLGDISFKSMWMPPPVNTDHSAVIFHGQDAFVIASSENVSHTPEDTPDNVNFTAVAALARALQDFIMYIDTSLEKPDHRA